MRNKKGFTLIELLAVIVVLAIIALIATPIVMNTIKNAKKGAAERTADNYIKQVETAVAEAKLGNNSVPDGMYSIQQDGNICPIVGCGENDKDKIPIDMSGNKPTKGTVVISNGEVLQNGTTMTVGDYDVIYRDNKYAAVTTVYRWSEGYINIGDTIDPNDTSKFTKDASILGKKNYLKHVLDKDNKVIESYACSILKDKEYCLKAVGVEYGYATNASDYKGNVLILKKIEDAKIEGINCSLEEEASSCSDASEHLYTEGDSEGVLVRAFGSDAICSVFDDGSSDCVCY